MSDIVDRLRTLRFPGLDGEPCAIPADDPLYLEAADEIDRLRRHLAEAHGLLTTAQHHVGRMQSFSEAIEGHFRVVREDLK